MNEEAIKLLRQKEGEIQKEIERLRVQIEGLRRTRDEIVTSTRLLSAGELTPTAPVPAEKAKTKDVTVTARIEIKGHVTNIYREKLVVIMANMSRIPKDAEMKSTELVKGLVMSSDTVIGYMKHLIDKGVLTSNGKHGRARRYKRSEKFNEKTSNEELLKRVEEERNLLRDVTGR